MKLTIYGPINHWLHNGVQDPSHRGFCDLRPVSLWRCQVVASFDSLARGSVELVLSSLVDSEAAVPGFVASSPSSFFQ